LQIPSSWPYSLPNSKGIQLNGDKQTKRQSAPLRITIAADLKEVCILEVIRSKTKQPIAIIDIRFATYIQVYETPILTKYLPEVIKQGIIIRKKEDLQEAYIFIPTIATVIWFSIFANSAFDIISTADKTQFNNVFSSLFIFLEHFPFHFVTFFIAGL
jgi:hypothetical protein